MNSSILTNRQYGWLALAFTLFVIYGSLVPLTPRDVSFEKACAHFVYAFTQPVQVAHRSDWAANVLLFIPLGFVAMGWRFVDRHPNEFDRRGDERSRIVLTIGLLLLAFAVLSALIEFTQIWFPPRHTSPNDVAAETLGGAIGIGAWLLCGQSITDYVRRFWSEHAGHNWAVRLIPGYLLILVIAQGMPFDLTISPSVLGRKYHEGRVLPIPLANWDQQPLDIVRKALIQFAYFLPAGVLISGLPGRIASGRNAFWRVLGIGILLAGAIEAMQLVIVTRFADSTDILTGALAVVLGWRLMHYFRNETDERRARLARAGLFLFWVVALIFIQWEPFDFSADRGFLAQRWQEFSPTPFADYYSGNYLLSFSAMLDKTLLFVPYGLFLAIVLGVHSPWRVVASAASFAMLLEAGQFFLRHHTPGLSDLILQPIGAWLGCLAAPRLKMLVRTTAANQAIPARVTSAS